MTDPLKAVDVKPPTRAKILVVEDDRDIAVLIEDWLSDTYEVVVALNGRSAIQKAVEIQPQAILLNVVMPELGGYDVVRLLQGTPQTKGIPVIVMSAKTMDEATVKMIRAEGNVFGCLTKPFKPSELVKMLEVVLKGERAGGHDAGRVSLVSYQGAPPVSEVSIEGAGEAEIAPLPVSKGEGAGNPDAGGGGASREESAVLGPRKAEGRSGLRSRTRMTDRSKEEEDSRPSRLLWLIKGVAKGTVLLAILTLGLFAAMEWTCRRAEEVLGVPFFTPPLYPASRFNSFLPYQWHDPKNTSPTYWDDGRVTYQFNQWGLRGPDFPLVTPAGVRRILLLGGTTVFGPGVGERDTIAQRLESLLNGGRKGPFQVINAGLWALSPAEQWEFVKGQGLDFKPEAIFWICENRSAGVPSSEGIRWLAARRWLASSPLAESRFIQLLVQLKIQGDGDPVPKENDPLFREAEKVTAEQKIAFAYWVLPRGVPLSAIRSNSEKTLSYMDAPTSFNVEVANRLARVVKKASD